MPLSNSSHGVMKYEVLPRAKQQQTFPHRRRFVRKKVALPQLTKSQSTLTQLDFATPHSSRDVIEPSSDEEHQRQLSKTKKRKRTTKSNEREAGQSSMTQFEHGDVLEFTKRRKFSEAGEDGFDIWEDYDPEKWETDTGVRQRARARALPWLPDDNGDAEIPETSQFRIESSPRVDSGVETMAGQEQKKFQTPRKVRFEAEVPSSQTPSSKEFSTPATIRHEVIQRSPLSEKSNNAQAAYPDHLSPESQNVSMRMLERVKFRASTLPFNRNTDAESSPERVKSSQEVLERPQAPLKRPSRRLLRSNTIQDSQVDDVEPLSASELIEHEANEGIPRFATKTTIQNSQSQDMDFDFPSQAGVNETFDYFANHEDTQYNGLQSTYDPVYSALDRDAARFGWTQTQPPLDRSDEDGEDSETDDEDLDAGCRLKSAGQVVRLSHEPSEESGHPAEFQSCGNQGQMAKDGTTGENKGPTPVWYRNGTKEPEPIAHYNEVQIPSSPPPPHPSQISTVVPTQLSQLPHPSAQQAVVMPSSKKTEAVGSYPILSSPDKPASLVPEILSSSPFPLPPCSSPKNALPESRRLFSTCAAPRSDLLESLVDFSLPPPPPLSSGKSTR